MRLLAWVLTIHPGEKNKRNGLLYGSNIESAGKVLMTRAMEGSRKC
jgi:hypothetical protein